MKGEGGVGRRERRVCSMSTYVVGDNQLYSVVMETMFLQDL